MLLFWELKGTLDFVIGHLFAFFGAVLLLWNLLTLIIDLGFLLVIVKCFAVERLM